MKKIAVFDVDGVVVRGQTQQLLVKYLFRKRKLNFYFLLGINFWFWMFKLGLVKDVIKIRERSFQVVKGWDVIETKSLLRNFIEEVIKKNFITKSIDLINKHKENGFEIILASASLKEIVDEIAIYLGVEESIATTLEQQKGFYTGKINGLVCYGDNKVFLLNDLVSKKSLTFSGSYMYTDDYSDMPLLKAVDNPCIVNPDSKLKGFSIVQGWKIYEF